MCKDQDAKGERDGGDVGQGSSLTTQGEDTTHHTGGESHKQFFGQHEPRDGNGSLEQWKGGLKGSRRVS